MSWNYHKTTDLDRERVRMFSLASMPQRAIAKELGLNVATVCRIQKQFGLTQKNYEPVSEETEKQILKLYREEKASSRKIAKQLGCELHRVLNVLQVHSLIPKPGMPGCEYAVPAKIQTAIRREYRAFEKHIADKYNLSDKWTRRFLRRTK